MKTSKFTSSACAKVVRDQTRSPTPCGLVRSKRFCHTPDTLGTLPDIAANARPLRFCEILALNYAPGAAAPGTAAPGA